MRCATAREQLARNLREPLEGSEGEALERHVAGCPRCREEQQEMLRLERALLAAAPAADAAPRVQVDSAAIFAGVAVRPTVPRRHWAMATAVTLLSVAGGYYWLNRSSADFARLGTTNRQAREPSRKAPPTSRVETHPKIDRLTGTRPPVIPPSPNPPVRRSPDHVAAGGPSRHKPEDIALLPAKNATPEPAQVVLQVIAPGATPTPPKPGSGRPAIPMPAITPAQVVAAEDARKTDLRGDPRLAMTISLDERDRPLGELLPEIGRRIGVPLSVGPEVSDDHATLFRDDTPAATVLSDLAEHFGYTWTRDRQRYELHQDLAARNAEAVLRRKELAPIDAELDLATRLLTRPPDQLKAYLKEQETQLQQADLPDSERARLRAEHQETLNVLLAPAAVRVSLALFRNLRPGQVERLLEAGELRSSTADGTLPAPLAAEIYASTSLLEMTEGNLPRVQADATIRLTDADDEEPGPPSQRGRHTRIEFRFTTLRGSREMPRNWGSQWIPELPAGSETSSRAAEPHDPDLSKRVDLTLPGPDRQPVPIVGGSHSALARTGAIWPRRARVSDVAAAIHHATGLQVVADSFVGGRLDPALLRGRQPLAHVLDTLSRELGYTWKKSGHVLWLRDRRYYADRPAEVPDRILRPFVTGTLATGSLSLDRLADLASAVTDTQARSLERYWGWYFERTGIIPPDWFFSRRQPLRFWAALSGSQRAALRSGGVLAVPQMTALQRELWATAFLAPPENHRTAASELHTPTPEQVASGGFSLHATEMQQLLFVRTGPDGKQRFGSTISVEGPASVDPRQYLHRTPGETNPEPEVAGPQQTLDSYHFRFHLGAQPQPARTVEILIPRLSKPMPADAQIGPSQ